MKNEEGFEYLEETVPMPTTLKEEDFMDEHDAEAIWQSWATKAGCYSTHLENVNTAMPDNVLIFNGLVVFNEIKMRRGKYIYMPLFQYTNILRMRHNLKTWQITYVVYTNHEDKFHLYTFDQIKSTNPEPAGIKKLKANITSLTPFAIISNQMMFENHIETVKDKAYNRKKPVLTTSPVVS